MSLTGESPSLISKAEEKTFGPRKASDSGGDVFLWLFSFLCVAVCFSVSFPNIVTVIILFLHDSCNIFQFNVCVFLFILPLLLLLLVVLRKEKVLLIVQGNGGEYFVFYWFWIYTSGMLVTPRKPMCLCRRSPCLEVAFFEGLRDSLLLVSPVTQ